MSAGVCVICGCTENSACDGGCYWVDEHEPLCSRCGERFPVGTTVMIALGPRTGRRGVVHRAPKLFMAHRYVDLAATNRADARRQLFHLRELVEIAK